MNEFFIKFVEYDLNSDYNRALLCELKGITLEPKKNLHDPLFIRVDYWTKLTMVTTLIFTNVDEFRIEINRLLLSLLSLDTHYFVYAIPDIEALQVFPELICLNLSIIKEVLHHETHDIGRGLLHLETLMEILQNTFTLDVFF